MMSRFIGVLMPVCGMGLLLSLLAVWLAGSLMFLPERPCMALAASVGSLLTWILCLYAMVGDQDLREPRSSTWNGSPDEDLPERERL